MTTPNWQHHSRKQPKYKSKPRMVQAARKRTKVLIKKLASQSAQGRASQSQQGRT